MTFNGAQKYVLLWWHRLCPACRHSPGIVSIMQHELQGEIICLYQNDNVTY